MNAAIRLYKRFYKFTGCSSELVDPFALNAASFFRGTDDEIENNVQIVKESTGVYYVELDALKYSFDAFYDLKWNVTYTPNSPEKVLLSTFNSSPVNFCSNIDVEIKVK